MIAVTSTAAQKYIFGEKRKISRKRRGKRTKKRQASNELREREGGAERAHAHAPE